MLQSKPGRGIHRPRAVTLRPAGEPDLVLQPLDPLAAAGGRDVEPPGRAAVRRRGDRGRAGSGPRRLRRPHAPLPDENAHAVGPLHLDERHVGPGRKRGMTRQPRAEPAEPFGVERRRQHHALRVAHRQHHCRHLLAAHVQRLLPQVSRRAHRRAEGEARGRGRQQLEPPDAGVGRDGELGAGRRRPLARPCARGPARGENRPQAPHAVAGDLGVTPVGVGQRHLRPVRGAPVADQPVGAEAARPVAGGAGQGRRVGARDLPGIHEQEVVAVGVRLDEGDLDRAAHGREKARKTSVRPTVPPIVPSFGVRP